MFAQESAKCTELTRSRSQADDGVYRFVLRHAMHAWHRGGWEQHHYGVNAYGQLGRHSPTATGPSQTIVVTGELGDVDI